MNGRFPQSPPALEAVVSRLTGRGARRDLRAAQAPDVSYGSDAGPPGVGPSPIRTREPGGVLVQDLQHPAFETVTISDQKMPERGMFDTSLGPGNNFRFDLLSYRVPGGMALWLYDYESWVNVFSGVDAGQAVRAEEGRFMDIMGIDLSVDGQRKGTLRYALDPSPIELTRAAFRDPRTGTTGPRARSFASSSGAGTSLLPVGPQMSGPRDEPWTWVVGEGQTVIMTAVVFRPFTTPIASIGGRIAGYLLNTQISSMLLERTRPQ